VATRVVRGEKPAARLWVFAPPHRLLASTARLSESTVVGFVTLDAAGQLQWGEASDRPAAALSAVEIVFDGGDVFQTEVTAPRLSEPRLRLHYPISSRIACSPIRRSATSRSLPAGRSDKSAAEPPRCRLPQSTAAC